MAGGARGGEQGEESGADEEAPRGGAGGFCGMSGLIGRRRTPTPLVDWRLDEEALARSLARARVLGGEFLAAIERWMKRRRG